MLCLKEEKKKFNAEVRQLVKSSPYLQMGNSNKSVSFRVRVPNCCPRCRSVEAAYMRRFVQKRDPRVLAHQKQQMKAFFALHFLPSREDNFLRFAMLNPKDLLFLISFDYTAVSDDYRQENIEKNQRDRAQKDKQKADQASLKSRTRKPSVQLSSQVL